MSSCYIDGISKTLLFARIIYPVGSTVRIQTKFSRILNQVFNIIAAGKTDNSLPGCYLGIIGLAMP